MTKITERDRINTLLTFAEVQADEGMVEFLNKKLDQLNKKNGANHKPTATQVENMAIKDGILNDMEAGVLYSVNQVSELPSVAPYDLTNQRTTSLLTQLVKTASIVRTEDKKGKPFYSLAE